MNLRCVAISLVMAIPLATVSFGVDVDFTSGDPAVKFAAEELKRLLGGVSGKIALREDPSMEAQAWRLKTEGDVLTISGRDGMGISYGVFTFLERHADVHWYAPDTEEIPDLSGWRIPKLDESGKPAFNYREMYVGPDFMDSTWRLRNKESNRASFGVGVHNGSPFDCHTFAYYSKALRAKRPDLFKGRPAASGLNCSDLCMTDEETRDFVAEEMCRYIESDAAKLAGKPKYLVPTFYDLSQNDGGSSGECMCPGCKALFEAAGSYSGPNIAFASAVAERVKRRHPEVTIQTFAYSYTMDPPTNDTKAADNICVRYCRSYIFRPLLPGTENGKILEAWSKHARQFGIWSYWRTYSGSLFPCMQPPDVIAKELRYCKKLGVARYMAEDESPLSRSFAMLQHWLLLKLADDPSLDEKTLVRRFMRGYYRSACKPMTDYLDYLVSRQEESRRFLDREFFEKANALMDEAERLAAGDEKALRHVRWERIVIDRSMYDVLGDLIKQGYSYDREKVTARFLPNRKDQIENWSGFKARHARPLVSKRLAEAESEARLYSHYPVAIPDEFKGREVVALEWNQIVPGGANVVDDPDAAAGAAFYNPKYEYKLPFYLGYYAPKEHKGETVSFEAREDVPQDEKYHLYRMGETVIMSPMYFHFDPTWEFRRYMQTVGIVPSAWNVWISMKLQGPAFVEGSKLENRVLIDRVFYVKGGDPMRGYRKSGGNLVPEKYRTIEVTGPKAGEWRGKWFSLGDPKGMENGFYVKGVVSYYGVVVPKKNVSRPFAGLWAVTSPGGKNAFSIPCCNFYVGDYEKVPFACVVEPDRLKRYVRRSGSDLNLTFRVNLHGQEGAVVKVEDLEIYPVVKDN